MLAYLSGLVLLSGPRILRFLIRMFWKMFPQRSVAQSCPTLCDPMDYSPPGSSVLGILQARLLEGFPLPAPGDLPDPGIEPTSPASPFFTTTATKEALRRCWSHPSIWWPLFYGRGRTLNQPSALQTMLGCSCFLPRLGSDVSASSHRV